MSPTRHPGCLSWPALLACPSRWPGVLHVGASPASVARVASGLVYLASPYSLQSRDPRTGQWSQWRSEDMAARAALASADLARAGLTAVSPIVQSATMCHADGMLDPLDERFWSAWCQPMLAACRAVVVPDIAGWRQSLGVWRVAGGGLGAGPQYSRACLWGRSMTIVITAAEAREAAYFRRQCEIVWWRLHAVAREDDLPFDLLLGPSARRDVTLAREDAALMGLEAGASRAALACILGTQEPDVRQMIARARQRRGAPVNASARAAAGGWM